MPTGSVSKGFHSFPVLDFRKHDAQTNRVLTGLQFKECCIARVPRRIEVFVGVRRSWPRVRIPRMRSDHCTGREKLFGRSNLGEPSAPMDVQVNSQLSCVTVSQHPSYRDQGILEGTFTWKAARSAPNGLQYTKTLHEKPAAWTYECPLFRSVMKPSRGPKRSTSQA